MKSPAGMSRGLMWVLAIAGGATAANLFYNQPLLPMMGGDLHAGNMGWVPTLTQAGYGLGMCLIVPLGDIIERRKLILRMTGLTALSLVGVALASSLALLVVASFVLGLVTVVPQITVPFAATLAPKESRGRVLGVVMSGLLVGVLLSRTLAGLLGDRLGWRAVFWIAAAGMVLLGVLLRFLLPTQAPDARLSYPQLLASTWKLAREEPLLRLHAFLGAMSFAAFNVFWATLAGHLAALPGHYGASVGGLYGAIGVVGAGVAPLVGRLADRRGGRTLNLVALGSVLLAFAMLAALGATLWGLALGVIVLDFGAQANQVTNQARVYALREDARSRLNTVYMTSYFIGGAVGAGVGSVAWRLYHWWGVCIAGAAFASLGLGVLVRHSFRSRATTSAGGASSREGSLEERPFVR